MNISHIMRTQTKFCWVTIWCQQLLLQLAHFHQPTCLLHLQMKTLKQKRWLLSLIWTVKWINLFLNWFKDWRDVCKLYRNCFQATKECDNHHCSGSRWWSYWRWLKCSRISLVLILEKILLFTRLMHAQKKK